MFIFFNNIFDICLKTEGCIAEEATIRYVLIGHIASVLHFHWTVESISILKIHKKSEIYWQVKPNIRGS